MSLTDRIKTSIATGVSAIASAFGEHTLPDYIEDKLSTRNLRNAGVLSLTLLASCGPTQEKLQSMWSNYFSPKNTHSSQEISVMEYNFTKSPSEFSQQFGAVLLQQMYGLSPNVATEFAKIPELNDGVSPSEARAMSSILGLLKNKENHTALNDLALDGANDYKFSAPLQALLWGYVDGRFDKNSNPLSDYTTSLKLTKKLWGDMSGPRWNDFEQVISRLNTPELVDHYQKRKFIYSGDGGRGERAQDPRTTFRKKGGDCEDYAIFASHALEKAGYETAVLDAYWAPIGHAVATFRKEGKLYILDNAPFYGKPSGIRGPFESNVEIGKLLAGEVGASPTELYVFPWRTLMNHYNNKTWRLSDSLI